MFRKKYLLGFLSVILTAVLAFAALTVLSPAAKGETGDDEAIEKAISGTMLAMQDVGKYAIEDDSAKVMQTGKVGDLTLSEKNYLAESYSEKLRESLSENSQLFNNLEDIRYNVLNDESPLVSSVYDTGIFSFEFVTNEISGNIGKAEACVISWQKYITETEPGLFKVVFPVSKTTITCEVDKEDGTWKVTTLNFVQHLFDGDLDKEKEFSSYMEAVEYANKTMPANIWAEK